MRMLQAPIAIGKADECKDMQNQFDKLHQQIKRLADDRETLAAEHKLHIETITRLTKERDALAAKLEQAEKLAETHKGYPTNVSLAIRALQSTGEKP